MTIETLKKGIMYLLSGEVETLQMGAKRKLENQMPITAEYICDEEFPKWLHSEEDLQTFHFTKSEYVSLLSESNKCKFTIDSEQAVHAIEVPIVAPNKSDSVQISKSVDESTESEDKFQIQVDQSYDYQPILWRTLSVSENNSPTDIRIDVTQRKSQLDRILSSILGFQNNKQEANTSIGLPAVVPTMEQPPVFFISVDTLRYDVHDELTSLIDELGQDAIFPTEPRTQGNWTPPSHASMFTGVHPGQHGYVGYGRGTGDKRPINPDLITIPELLAQNGYKNSALVSHSRILPEFGFGRGFHRFCHDGMSATDWVSRAGDAKSSVNLMIDWIEKDLTSRDHSLFYFLHVFDPHYPYIPPVERLDSPDIDFSKSRRFKNQMNEARGDNWTYLDGYHNKYELDPELVRDIKNWYSKSVEYTGDQIVRLLQYLKAQDMFEKSLIIITGDHGEEFGERGFFTHSSLYDGNIRPFMAIKPPEDELWPRKDHIDTIDFLPTIAQLAGEKIPEQCHGTPIQVDEEESPRITERIYPDWYSISIEVDNTKAIFTYDSNYPDRPTQKTIQERAELEEFYQMSDIRANNIKESNIPTGQRDQIRQIADEFLMKAVHKTYSSENEAKRPSQETIEQLQKLGYK